MKKFTLFLFLYPAFFMLHSFAQPGTIDSTFNFSDIGFNNGSGSSTVYATSIQSDGKIIIGGLFDSYNSIPRNRIARLNSDGTLDNTFNPGTGASNVIETLSLQGDGKIIIGGWFISYNGTGRNRIARINTNGSLDNTFAPGIGANNKIKTTALQSDGKIIIGGYFTSYSGTARNYIARLNTDGSLDTTFNPGTGANNNIQITHLQTDGKIIIGGNFTSYNGTARNYIARLNADGSLDTTFAPGTGANNYISSISVQSDSKVIIGGAFTSYNATTRNRIARLNTDGSLDMIFNPGTGADDNVLCTSIQGDGKIIIGGAFNFYYGTFVSRIARLNVSGSIDNSFGLTGADNSIYSISIQANGKLIIGGSFSHYIGIRKLGINRLNADGSPDITFNPCTGADDIVYTSAIQSDGKIIIGGFFDFYNGVGRNIARLKTDGSLDSTFNPGVVPYNSIWSIAIQSDGKIVVGGGFNSISGAPRNCIARLNADGSIDNSFNPGTGANSYVFSTSIQSDGKIIIGGDFTSYNGTGRNRIARLNPDGTLDNTFDPGIGANYGIRLSSIQSDGKIIIGGDFTSYNGTGRNCIARLNPNGTLDNTFDPGIGANYGIRSGSIQSDGKIIIAGALTSFNGISRNYIVRINIDGSLDATFNSGTGPDNSVFCTSLQSDGKIIIGGLFTSVNATPRNYLARINMDGSLDTSFDVGTGADNHLLCTSLQNDGKIIIGGGFTSYNGIGRNRIARINGGAYVSVPEISQGNLFLLTPNPATNEIKIESASSKIESIEIYDVLGQLQTTNYKPQTNSVDVSALNSGIYFVKVRGEKEERVGKFVKQ